MAEVYDTTRFGELYYASRTPATNKLALAAKYVTEVFAYYQTPYAIIGGWAIFLRGSRRDTQDVDITVGVTMEHLKQILLADARICFPAIHGQTCVQIFVKTGRSHDVGFPQTDDLAVSMDIVISGNLGTPSNLDNNTCEHIAPRVSTPQGTSAVVLGLFFQIYAKLDAFSTRGNTSNNDFRDLVFLMTIYGPQISSFKNHLKMDHRRAFVQKFATIYVGDDNAIAHVKQLFAVT